MLFRSDSVGDFSKQSVGTSYDKGATMTLFTFTMYYKYSTESEGKVIPPVDDGTPASNKARIPCRPDASAAPDWVSNLTLIYQVNFDISGISHSRTFNTWDDFIAFWDSIHRRRSGHPHPAAAESLPVRRDRGRWC